MAAGSAVANPPKKMSLLNAVKSLAPSSYAQVMSPNLTPESTESISGFAEDDGATSPPNNERQQQKASLLPALREDDESDVFA